MRFVSGRLTSERSLLQADLLDQQPQEVLVREALLVGEALVGSVCVYVRAVLGVRVQALLALALGALAGRADVHHQLRSMHLLGERERARVERVRQLLVVLGDHARSATVGAVELDQLDVQQWRHLRHRAVQLGGEAAAHAAGPVGDLHVVLPSGAWAVRAHALASGPRVADPHARRRLGVFVLAAHYRFSS